MLPDHAAASQAAGLPKLTPAAAPAAVRIGVGIDTARYGHYAVFLRDDLQPAAAELPFTESAQGYAQLRQRLQQIAQRHTAVHLVIRLDAAGQYADNLLHFLHGLATPGADAAAMLLPVKNAWKNCWFWSIADFPRPITSTPFRASATSPPPSSPPASSTSTASTRPANSSNTSARCPSRSAAVASATARRAAPNATS